MDLKNIGLGVLVILEKLGSQQEELSHEKQNSTLYREWWQKISKELEESKKGYEVEEKK